METGLNTSPHDRGAPPQVPDFDLLRRIGEGGFGEVWLGRNRTTRRLRAVKLIPLRAVGRADPAGREMVSLTHLEARLKSDHPHLLAIHHVGRTDEHLFYVMDLADDAASGSSPSDPDYRPATLDDRLTQGPLPAEECLRSAGQLLAGLACLHAAGMVHRDVKPSNCLFVEGQLKLADFGLLTEADRQASRVGTRAYMPPDGRMDTGADVYAAGLVIYEMVAGLPAERFPCLGDRGRQFGDDPVLARLNRLVLKACQPEASERFRDAREMLAELEGPAKPAPAATGRFAGRMTIAAASLLVILAATVWALWPETAPKIQVNFITDPFEATIQLDGQILLKPDGTPYRTPCTVPDLPAGTHDMVFRHEGLADRHVGRVDFNQTREITVRWNEAGEDQAGR